MLTTGSPWSDQEKRAVSVIPGVTSCVTRYVTSRVTPYVTPGPTAQPLPGRRESSGPHCGGTVVSSGRTPL